MTSTLHIAPKPTLISLVTFSVATFPVSALGVALFVYLPPYLAGHLGVALTAISGTWATVRVVDLFVDPVLGHMMDRTRTPFGRYRAWLAAGVPILMLAVYMLFMAPVGIGAGYLLVWLFGLYIGNSILTLSQWAWGATLATQYHERSRVFGILTAVGVAAAVLTLLIPIAAPSIGLSNAQGVQAMGWFVILVAPLSVGLTVWRTPERLSRDVHRQFAYADYWDIIRKPEVVRLFLCQVALTLGPGWMSAMYLFYFTDVRGFSTQQATVLLLVYILSGVGGAPLTARAAMRFGKHQTLIATTTAFSIGLFAVFLIPVGNLFAALPVMLWCGFMAAGFGLMINAMMADVGDEIRLQQGKERISLLYAVLAFASKIAAAAAISVTFFLLSRIGYNAAEGAHNSAEALNGLLWVFLAGPMMFVMLGGLCVVGWKLDADRHAGVRAKLDARDAALETSDAR
jgi:glycoside/pentoside/hexuronide:cation symporter, GPH family